MNEEIKREESLIDILDEQYQNSDNKKEIDYWTPLSKIIVESIELRSQNNLSQKDLAKLMKTTQSVISRFENMGRLPSYDFFARMAQSLGHAPGMTLYGDFMAVVPIEKQNLIKEIAKKQNISTQNYVQSILDQNTPSKQFDCQEALIEKINSTTSTSIDYPDELNNSLSTDEVVPYPSLKVVTSSVPYQYPEAS